MSKVVKVFAPDSILPEYQTEFSAGCDAHSLNDYIIPPKSAQLVDTGLIVEIPEGYEIQVRSRSGLALKKNVFVLNSPGCCDADYRGTIGVILYNLGNEPFEIKKGDRVAQLILNQIEQIHWERVASFNELSPTDRGAGGFGHTGTTHK